MEPQQSEARAPILAAFSPSAPAREPVEFGLAASRLTGAPLVVIAVRHAGAVVSPSPVTSTTRPTRTGRSSICGSTSSAADSVTSAVEEVKARTVGEGLGQAIEAHKALLVVIGSSPRGRAGTVLLGSSAGELVHQGRCPVAVVPKDHRLPDEGVKVVGGAFELGDDGAEALLSAAALASSAGVRLRAVTVVDAKEAADPADVEARVRELLGDAAGDRRPRGRGAHRRSGGRARRRVAGPGPARDRLARPPSAEGRDPGQRVTGRVRQGGVPRADPAAGHERPGGPGCARVGSRGVPMSPAQTEMFREARSYGTFLIVAGCSA
jgi:nucleotide-binding universal stress UspA family protein